MKNWTDSCINWNSLTGTEVKRLIATWGKDEAFIAKYDKKHGIVHTPLANPAPVAKTATPKKIVKKTVVKKVAAKPATRQKHTGADGEIKFVEHRNLFVGFMGGKVVVTKRTEAQCREFLVKEYGAE